MKRALRLGYSNFFVDSVGPNYHDLVMTHLYKKIIKGRTYWYLRETMRVEGKVRVKWQKYLGTPDAIKERLDAASSQCDPVRLITEAYGAVFVADLLERRLGTIAMIDSIVPRHRNEVGPTVGEYFFYAWANRLVAPKSKRALEDWYRKTAIQLIRPIDLSQLTSQRYWEKWERVSADAVEKIGDAFLKKIWEEQKVPPECVLFDTTNYFTYMSSHTDSELAQRGHNKAGKHQLRQIGIGLLVDRNTQLPLYYRAYEGNKHDSKYFRNIIDEMFGILCDFNKTKQRLTVVFDKGMNSDENIEFIDESTRIHFITTYSPYFAEDLAATDIKRFVPLSIRGNVRKDEDGRSADKMSAFRTKLDLWGKERTIVVTHNPVNARKKSYSLAQKLESVREVLLEFRKNYRESKVQWRDSDAIEQRYVRLCGRLHIAPQHYVLDFGDRRSAPEMSFRKDDSQVKKTEAFHGRNIIVTDNHDWSTEEIVQLTLDRYFVEKQFRASKSPHHVNMNPFFHWTDGKLRCQILMCVMSLTALRLLEIEIEKSGLHTRLGSQSGRAILEEMQALNSVVIWSKGAAAPTVRVEDPTGLQHEILKALGYRFENGSVLQV